MNYCQLKKAVIGVLLATLLTGCAFDSIYKPERNNRAGICYEKYIEGKTVSESCHKSIRYGG